nr:MAG TPA: hypothetical protein [Caudoviricetes sp.]
MEYLFKISMLKLNSNIILPGIKYYVITFTSIF